MIVCRIEGSTRVLGAPPQWQPDISGHCAGLPVRDVVEGGLPWMISMHEPTPEEMKLLAAGGRIQLWVQGVTHPVVGMLVVASDLDLPLLGEVGPD